MDIQQIKESFLKQEHINKIKNKSSYELLPKDKQQNIIDMMRNNGMDEQEIKEKLNKMIEDLRKQELAKLER